MSNSVPNQVYVYQDSPNQVTVDEEAPTIIEVRLSAGGTNTRRHVHTQGSPSQTWTINHTLGGKPSVMVVDSADTVVFGDVSYVSNSEVRLEFTAPFSGFAYLT